MERRWAIIAHWKELSDLPKVAAKLNERLRVVTRWVKRYQLTGSVDDAHRRGRPPVMTEEATQRAFDMLFHEDVGGASAAAQGLHAASLTPRVVHRTTVSRAAHRMARGKGEKVDVLTGKPKKQLSAATMQKRLAFCTAHLGRTWDNVMFTDRKKFPFNYPGHKVQPVTWCLRGRKREAPSVNHALVVNVYAGITKHGVTDFHVVAGTSKHQSMYKNKKGQGARNITAEEYKEVVRTTLLPGGRKLFSHQGVGSWVFQQDNDPTHKAALPVVDEWNTQHGSSVSMLKDWPPSSPDLSPIENFWGYLGRKMDAKGCATFQEFQAALLQEAKATPPRVFSNLVGSMKKRLTDCINKGGGKTKY